MVLEMHELFEVVNVEVVVVFRVVAAVVAAVAAVVAEQFLEYNCNTRV